MKAKRRKFIVAFKSQIAIEALKERATLAELTKRFEINSNMISKWRSEIFECSTEFLETTAPYETFFNFAP